jgi:hypothetical protein
MFDKQHRFVSKGLSHPSRGISIAMFRRFGLPMIAAALLIACATILVASRDFDDASVQLVQVQIPLSVTEKLRHAVRKQPRDPAAYWPVFPQLYVFFAKLALCSHICVTEHVVSVLSAAFSYPHCSYSINMVNGHIVSNGAATDATGPASPMLQRIHAAKLLKEKVSAMLQDAVNINSQSKALRAQASYTRQQAADVKAEEDALRSKILDVNAHLKVSHRLSSSSHLLASFSRTQFSHAVYSRSCFPFAFCCRLSIPQSTCFPAKRTACRLTANGRPKKESPTLRWPKK